MQRCGKLCRTHPALKIGADRKKLGPVGDLMDLGSWIKIKSLELETGVYRGREMLFSGTVPPDMPPYFGRAINLFIRTLQYDI